MKKLVLFGIIFSVFIIGAISDFTLNPIINDMRAENEKLTLEFGYATEMLRGFLHDEDGTREQVKAIRENPNDSI